MSGYKKWWGSTFGYVAVIGFSCLVWVGSSYLFQRYIGTDSFSERGGWGDLVTIMFGAASIALFVFSILIALLAVLGWKTIESIIDERVENVTSRKLKILESEMRGRILIIQGHILGEMSIPPGKLSPTDEFNAGRLRDALRLTQLGYDLLNGEGVKEPARFMALNNLVFYSCAAGCRHKESLILEHARELRKAGLEHDSVDLLLTSSRAILQCSTVEEEKSEARKILGSLVDGAIEGITENQKKEAKLYLDSFLDSTPRTVAEA